MGHLNNFVRIWDKQVVKQHNSLQMGDNLCSISDYNTYKSF